MLHSNGGLNNILRKNLFLSGAVNPLTPPNQVDVGEVDQIQLLLQDGLEDPLKNVLDGFGLDENSITVENFEELQAAAILEMRRRTKNLKRDYTLKEFLRVAWLLVEQRPFIDNWHIDILCDVLEAMLEGWLKNVIINIPPRHMKSILISVIFPAYAWTRYPEMQFLTASYSEKLSIRDAVRSRRIIESHWFQQRWGMFAPEPDYVSAIDNLLPRRAYTSLEAFDYYGLERRIVTERNKIKEAASSALAQQTNSAFIKPKIKVPMGDPMDALNLEERIFYEKMAKRPKNTVAKDFKEYRAILLGDQNQKHRYENTLHGHRISTSVDGGVMGDGGDFLLMDDPLKAADAHSDTVRIGTNEWIQENWVTRKNSPFSAELLIMQRLHEHDPSGFAIAEMGNYHHIRLPMEYIPEKRFLIEVKHILPAGGDIGITKVLHKYLEPLDTVNKILSFSGVADEVKRDLEENVHEADRDVPIRKADRPIAVNFKVEDPRAEEHDILWKARYTPTSIANLKKSLGTYGTSGQLQQEPAPEGGGKIKEFWWRYWHLPDNPLPNIVMRDSDGQKIEIQSVPLPDKFDKMAQSWDCNFKDDKDADEVAGGVWGTLDAYRYLLEADIRVMSIQQVMDKILKWHTKYYLARHKFIEQAANGPAIEQLLRRKVSGIRLVPTKEIGGSKMARVTACEPEIESGHVYLPHPSLSPFTRVIINQASMFPKGVKDDGLDMVTLGLIKLATLRNNIH